MSCVAWWPYFAIVLYIRSNKCPVWPGTIFYCIILCKWLTHDFSIGHVEWIFSKDACVLGCGLLAECSHQLCQLVGFTLVLFNLLLLALCFLKWLLRKGKCDDVMDIFLLQTFIYDYHTHKLEYLCIVLILHRFAFSLSYEQYFTGVTFIIPDYEMEKIKFCRV